MFNDMMRAEIWLQEELASQKKIEDLASCLGYSESQVRRNFKRCFGVSPSTYRDNLRLKRAALLLAHTTQDISVIAARCGYLNHSAFSRAFHRRYNVSPREYRRSERRRQERRCRQMDSRFPMVVRVTPVQYAIVTRLYDGELDIGSEVACRRLLDLLSEKLRASPPLAILHGPPLQSDGMTTDLGVSVDADTFSELAVPLPFRRVTLPACRHACVSIAHIAHLSDALEFLLLKGIPESAEHIDGQPIQLAWSKPWPATGTGKKEAVNRIEVRIPLMAAQ